MKNMINITPLEEEALILLAEGRSTSSTSIELGIPTSSLANMLRKEGMRERLIELKEARREAVLNYVTNVAVQTLESKMESIENDPEKNLGNSTRKDHMDIVKMIHDMLAKPTGVGASESNEENNPLAKIYQQINVIQNA